MLLAPIRHATPPPSSVGAYNFRNLLDTDYIWRNLVFGIIPYSGERPLLLRQNLDGQFGRQWIVPTISNSGYNPTVSAVENSSAWKMPNDTTNGNATAIGFTFDIDVGGTNTDQYDEWTLLFEWKESFEQPTTGLLRALRLGLGAGILDIRFNHSTNAWRAVRNSAVTDVTPTGSYTSNRYRIAVKYNTAGEMTLIVNGVNSDTAAADGSNRPLAPRELNLGGNAGAKSNQVVSGYYSSVVFLSTCITDDQVKKWADDPQAWYRPETVPLGAVVVPAPPVPPPVVVPDNPEISELLETRMCFSPRQTLRIREFTPVSDAGFLRTQGPGRQDQGFLSQSSPGGIAEDEFYAFRNLIKDFPLGENLWVLNSRGKRAVVVQLENV